MPLCLCALLSVLGCFAGDERGWDRSIGPMCVLPNECCPSPATRFTNGLRRPCGCADGLAIYLEACRAWVSKFRLPLCVFFLPCDLRVKELVLLVLCFITEYPGIISGYLVNCTHSHVSPVARSMFVASHLNLLE